MGRLRRDRDPSVVLLGAILVTPVVELVVVVRRNVLLFVEAFGLDKTVRDAMSPFFCVCVCFTETKEDSLQSSRTNTLVE